MKLLHLDASARNEESTSRLLSKHAVGHLLDGGGQDLVYRDLNTPLIPYLDGITSEAFFTPPNERSAQQLESLSVSDALVEEFLRAEVLVLGTPMYNFTVPAPLKSYLDQIIRPGLTFRKVADGHLEGLCQLKHAIVCTSSGGKFSDTNMDFLRPYLREVLSFIGVKKIHVVNVERTNQSNEIKNKAINEAYELIESTVATIHASAR